MAKRHNKNWTDQEERHLKAYFNTKSFEELAENLDRTVDGVKRKCNKLNLCRRSKPAKLGDVIKGWKIVKIYEKPCGKQNKTYADVESTISDKKSTYVLTLLTQRKIGWPDRRRPDIQEKHGQTNTRLYRIWGGMKSRCYNPNQTSYKNYGKKGVCVCEEWMEFENFYYWATNNGYDDNLSLDRIDHKKNYEPSNCRWATPKEQSNNKNQTIMITAWGETKNTTDWTLDNRCKTSCWSLRYRIKQGWEPEKAISTPSRYKSVNLNVCKFIYEYVKENYPDIIEEFYKQYNS